MSANLNRYVVGLDLSLTATGLADVNIDDSAIDCLWTYGTKGKRKATYTERSQRLSAMRETIVRWVLAGQIDPELIVLEGPSYGSHVGSQHDRSGLWWMIANAFHERDCPVLIVPPKSRAKYATGNGNSGKDVVMAHTIERYAHQCNRRIANDNEADALVLAAMGARWLGEPLEEELHPDNLKAMASAVLL